MSREGQNLEVEWAVPAVEDEVVKEKRKKHNAQPTV